MLWILSGCGPAPTSSAEKSDGVVPVADKSPPVTEAQIERDVVGKGVEVSDAAGEGASDTWTFQPDEYRHVRILESKRADGSLMIVVYMTTRNNPQPDEDSIQVSGKLRLKYEKHGAKWGLADIENLNFKYSVGVGI